MELELSPGVVNTPTKSSKSANWREVHLMRWSGTRLCPVGGWSKYDYAAMPSTLRKMHVWSDNLGVVYTAFMCEGHVLVDSGDGLVDITPAGGIVKPDTNIAAGGFGDNVYDLNAYGTTRPDQPTKKDLPFTFFIDNWGEDLVFLSSTDGRLLRWKPSDPAGTLATAVPNAPVQNRAMVVTPERYVILFGYGGNFSQYAWCDEEDIENWNFADVTSKAGNLPVEPAAPFITAVHTSAGVYAFTARRPYLITFRGLPAVFGHDPMPEGALPVSPSAVIETPIGTVWMAPNGIWMANGLSVTPVQCPVWNWVTTNVNALYTRYRAFAVHLSGLSEVWFFFCSKNAENPDRYILWNYAAGWWSMGNLSRTCGISSSYITFPMMSDGTNVFKHEDGYNYPAGTVAPWAETFPVSASPYLSTFVGMWPDVEGGRAAVQFRLSYNLNRVDDAILTDPVSVYDNGFVPFRTTGRDFRLRVQSATLFNSDSWTLGNCDIELKRRGRN